MSHFTIVFLSSLLVILAVVNSQEYFDEDYDLEPDVKVKKDVGQFTLNRNGGDVRGNLRYRRDDEVVRHRRQGGHGNGNGGGHEGITGPVHTFVKTDEHAHFKWGVRHHVGHEYAGHH